MATLPRLFISHPWAVHIHHFALRVVEALRMRHLTVWIDEEQMLPGQPIEERQRNGIEHETDVFVFTISQSSIESKNCMQELNTAVSLQKPIISLLIERIETPASLAGCIAVDFINPLYFDASVDRLVAGAIKLHRVHSIAQTLDDDDPERRCEAARLLRDLHASEFLHKVIERLGRERDSSVTYWLLLTIGGLVRLKPEMSNFVYTLLRDHASNGAPLVRRGALDALQLLHKI